jgi:hypothetical protein
VIKVFYEPSELAARLAELGWSASVREVNPLVLSGIAQPASA